jgi:hypothetical protein
MQAFGAVGRLNPWSSTINNMTMPVLDPSTNLYMYLRWNPLSTQSMNTKTNWYHLMEFLMLSSIWSSSAFKLTRNNHHMHYLCTSTWNVHIFWIKLKLNQNRTNSILTWTKLSCKYPTVYYTPLAVVSRARKTLRVSTTATIAQIPTISSKDGAVIGAVLSTRKFHRGHHWHQTHMNNCWINEITNKLNQ